MEINLLAKRCASQRGSATVLIRIREMTQFVGESTLILSLELYG